MIYLSLRLLTLVEKEMAKTAEDILFRRTKVGIDFPSEIS